MTQVCSVQGDDFCKNMVDGARLSASIIVPLVVSLFPACETVVEMRCATGVWLKEFLFAGKKIHGYGADLSIPEYLTIPLSCFTPGDTANRCSIGHKYDLALCVDTAEHIPQEEVDAFVSNLVGSADIIIFSAAVPGQNQLDQCNEQWPRYWEKKFRNNGFRCFDVLRPYFWRDNRIEFRYRQSLLVFVREDIAAEYPELAAMPSFHAYPLIHPDMYAILAAKLEVLSKMSPPSTPMCSLKGALKASINRRISQQSVIRKCYRKLKKIL